MQLTAARCAFLLDKETKYSEYMEKKKRKEKKRRRSRAAFANWPRSGETHRLAMINAEEMYIVPRNECLDCRSFAITPRSVLEAARGFVERAC